MHSLLRTAAVAHLHSSTFSSVARVATVPFVYFYNDIYKVNLPEKHKFPMDKYASVRMSLNDRFRHSGLHSRTTGRGVSTVDEIALGSTSFIEFRESPLATEEELRTTHCSQYIDRFINGKQTEREIRVVGFPWSEQGVRRSLSSVGGTLAATRYVLSRAVAQQAHGRARSVLPLAAAHLAGGTHHAFYDRGEGFCVFNDIAVAANCAMLEYPTLVKRCLIIDLDTHQGNGTAALFSKNPNIFTFNMHCKSNVFSELQVSDVDVELNADCSGEEYLQKLDYWLPFLFETLQPQLVFFQAGVDVLATDRLGRLGLTRDDVRKRNATVYRAAFEHNSSLVVTMGGGYPRDLNPSSDEYMDTIGAHVDVYEQLVQVWEDMSAK